jgi:hypothetical protein
MLSHIALIGYPFLPLQSFACIKTSEVHQASNFVVMATFIDLEEDNICSVQWMEFENPTLGIPTLQAAPNLIWLRIYESGDLGIVEEIPPSTLQGRRATEVLLTAADFDVNHNSYSFFKGSPNSRVGGRVIALNMRNTGHPPLRYIPANKQKYHFTLLMKQRRVSNLFFIIRPVTWYVEGNRHQFKVMDESQLIAHLFGRYRPSKDSDNQGAQTDAKRATTDEITKPRSEIDWDKELLYYGIPNTWNHAGLFEEFIKQMAELMKLEDNFGSSRSRGPSWTPEESQEIFERAYKTNAEVYGGMGMAEGRDARTLKNISVDLPESLYLQKKSEHMDSSGKYFLSSAKRQVENHYHVLEMLLRHPPWEIEDGRLSSFK